MALSTLNNIAPLLSGDLMGVVIPRINENSLQTNEIREVVETHETRFSDIGNLSTLAYSGTLVEGFNTVYEQLDEINNATGMTIEFLAAAPPIVAGQLQPSFYFNTASQTLMVWHEGQQRYYPAFGCNSIINSTLAPAPVWESIIIVPPPPPMANCYALTQALSPGEVLKIGTLPNYINMVGSVSRGSASIILSSTNNGTNVYSHDIRTNVVTLVASTTAKIVKPALLMGADPNLVYAIGGKTQNAFSSKIYKINLSAHTIVEIANAPISFKSQSISYNSDLSRGFIFGGESVLGGYSASALNTILEFNFATETMTTLATHLPIGLIGIAATKYVDSSGLIYLAGGRTNNQGMNNSLSTEILSFDPLTKVLTEVANLPSGRSDGTLLCANNELIYAGGYESGANGCIAKSSNVTRIFPVGVNWMFTSGSSFVPNSAVDVYANEDKGCGYATYFVNNGTTNDDVYLIGL